MTRRSAPLDSHPTSALRNIDEWLERYRRFWEANFDRLDAYLKEQQAKEKKAKKARVKKKS